MGAGEGCSSAPMACHPAGQSCRGFGADLPNLAQGEGPFLQDTEVVLRLHDEDDSGRLFKMPTW